MKVIHGLGEGTPGGRRVVLTVGNFDGVHRGHQRIIAVARELAAHAGVEVWALTFEPHPLAIITPDRPPQRLTTADQKLDYLQAAGVDVVVVAESTPDLLSQPAEVFLRDIVKRFAPTYFVEGRNFGFGKGRRGNVETLKEFADELGYRVEVVDPVMQSIGEGQSERVSSSLIRKLLLEGHVETAAAALGRGYALSGVVVRGAGRGEQLGFPTANLGHVAQLVPADGVYAGRALIDGETLACAISIGTTPTFGESARQIEAFLLGFYRDIYDRPLTIEFVTWIREQRRFAGREELMDRISQDVAAVQSALETPGNGSRK